MSQPTVSKHLRVLREAGFVESTVDAQRRLYRLKPEPFEELDAWLARFRRFWPLTWMLSNAPRSHGSVNTNERKTRRRRGPNRERDKENEMKIKVTSLYVDNQDKALRFYTEVLGFGQEDRLQSRPISLADRGLARGPGRH